MPMLFVRQKVEDFEKWYQIFKSHEKAQGEAGLKDLQLLRDVTDKNTIICIFQVDHIEKAKAFTESPQSSQAQVDSGIIGTPDVYLLEEIFI